MYVIRDLLSTGKFNADLYAYFIKIAGLSSNYQIALKTFETAKQNECANSQVFMFFITAAKNNNELLAVKNAITEALIHQVEDRNFWNEFIAKNHLQIEL